MSRYFFFVTKIWAQKSDRENLLNFTLFPHGKEEPNERFSP